MVRSCSSLSKLLAALRSESGVAVPTVLSMILIGLAVGGAAAVAAIGAQRGSVRDEDSKQGIAGADAGALRALQRQNLVSNNEDPCVVLSGGVLTPGPDDDLDGWCPELTGSVGDTDYGYTVSTPTPVPPEPGEQGREEVTVVATGTSDDVTRRIAVTINKLTGAGLLSGATVMGLDEVNLDSNAEVHGNVATNGNIVLASNATLCGNAQYGVGHGLLISGNAEQCDGYSHGEGELSLPPVDQGDVPTVNSNERLVTGEDVSQGKSGCANAQGQAWDPATRTLCLSSNSALTLGGTNYSFCRLELRSNSTLYIAQGAQVQVFFDSPENCGYTEDDAPVAQFVMNSNTKISNTSGDPTTAAFLMVGSETISTTAELNSNSNVNIDLILYAPFTDVSLDSNSTFRGSLAARTIDVDSNAEIQSDPRVSEFEVPIRTVFEVGRYVECSGTDPGTDPDAGC